MLTLTSLSCLLSRTVCRTFSSLKTFHIFIYWTFDWIKSAVLNIALLLCTEHWTQHSSLLLQKKKNKLRTRRTRATLENDNSLNEFFPLRRMRQPRVQVFSPASPAQELCLRLGAGSFRSLSRFGCCVGRSKSYADFN